MTCHIFVWTCASTTSYEFVDDFLVCVCVCFCACVHVRLLSSLETAPSGVVQDIQIRNGTVTRFTAIILVQFQPLQIKQRNGIIRGYSIHVLNGSGVIQDSRLLNIGEEEASNPVQTVWPIRSFQEIFV